MTRQTAYAARRAQAGWRRVEVWLSPDDQQRLERLTRAHGSAQGAVRAALKPNYTTSLLAALRDAVSDLEQTLSWRGEGWECSEDELLGGYRKIIARASVKIDTLS